MAKKVNVPKEYAVPLNWKWMKLGDYIYILSGYPFKANLFSKKREEGRPLIRIRDVVRGETQTFTDEDCPEEYVIHKGDILIGMDGDFNVAKWKSEDALLNQRVCYLRCDTDLISNDVIFYFLPDVLKK